MKKIIITIALILSISICYGAQTGTRIITSIPQHGHSAPSDGGTLRAYIPVSRITGSIDLVTQTTGSLLTENIADLAVTNAKIAEVDVAKLTAGTIDSKTITLVGSTGDVKIQAGKTSFSDTTAGFILGIDRADSNKAKFVVGNATNYMLWSGATLSIRGSITADDITAGTLNVDRISADSIDLTTKVTGTLPLARVALHGHNNNDDGGIINLPIFSATNNGASEIITCASTTVSKYNVIIIDNMGWYNTTTYRYTPQIAGYYLFSNNTGGSASPISGLIVSIIKNNSITTSYSIIQSSAFVGSQSSATTAIAYMNGTTDYIDSRIWVNGTGACYADYGGLANFSGILLTK